MCCDAGSLDGGPRTFESVQVDDVEEFSASSAGVNLLLAAWSGIGLAGGAGVRNAEARTADPPTEEKRAFLRFPSCRTAIPEQWRPVVHELAS